MMSSSGCSFCASTSATYICPRCNQPYCTLACYRHEKHLDCVNQFNDRTKREHADAEQAFRQKLTPTERSKLDKHQRQILEEYERTGLDENEEQNDIDDDEDDQPEDLQYLADLEERTHSDYNNLSAAELERQLTAHKLAAGFQENSEGENADVSNLLSQLTAKERERFAQMCEELEFDESEFDGQSVFRKKK